MELLDSNQEIITKVRFNYHVQCQLHVRKCQVRSKCQLRVILKSKSSCNEPLVQAGWIVCGLTGVRQRLQTSSQTVSPV